MVFSHVRSLDYRAKYAHAVGVLVKLDALNLYRQSYLFFLHSLGSDFVPRFLFTAPRSRRNGVSDDDNVLEVPEVVQRLYRQLDFPVLHVLVYDPQIYHPASKFDALPSK
jgi:hypothetical protein